jgi:hypothetical protein
MGTGRFYPGFERYGGGPTALQTILNGLNQARGTAYDTETDGIIYAENEAIARMLWVAWEQNQRFANQFDPQRMTDFLPRWEKILGIVPLPSMTAPARRRVVADRFSRIGITATRQELTDRLQAELGDIFSAYETTALADATQVVPIDIPAWPSGPPPATRIHAPNADPQWMSTTAHIRIKVTRPSYMSTGEFWQKIEAINPIMDALTPAWVTWGWYTETGSPGFFLDEENNLDHHIFD